MNRLVLGLLALTMVASAESSLAGTWQGKMNNLPGVNLTVREAGGNVSGSIVFYFQTRGDDGNWQVKAKTLNRYLRRKQMARF